MEKMLAQGKVYIECGPVQMIIIAERGGQPLTRELRKVDKKVNEILTSLSKFLVYAKKPWPCLNQLENLPKVLIKMLDAVTATGNESLTPMAAVAGSFSDIIADFLAEEGATKVIVNNGGDIALRLKAGETTRVGISPKIGAKATHFITINSNSRIGGIATSGLGGRGLTQGIADAVVVFAKNAVLADACATDIANNTNINSPLIARCLARELNPDTDIPNLLVTLKVDQLTEEVVEGALKNGLKRTRQLVENGLILGAAIFVAGKMIVWPKNLSICPLNKGL